MKASQSQSLRVVTRNEGFHVGVLTLESSHAGVRGANGHTVRFDEKRAFVSPSAPETRTTEAVRPRETFYRDLLALRLGFSEFLLAKVVDHLRHRSTGESTILLQQLVKAQLGDIAIGHLEIEAAMSTADLRPREVHQLDRRITDIDRAILRLFGGWGYLRGEESDCANVSEQLLSIYDVSAEGGDHG